MEEDSHKKLCKISGASICVSLQVKDHSTHAMNFTKMTRLNSLMHCFWLKKKSTASSSAALFLKANDTVSVVADKNESSVLEVSRFEQS